MSTLNQKNFQKLLAGKKTQLPKKVRQELKTAGMDKVFSANQVNESQALRVIRHLQKQKIIPATNPPQKLYQTALKTQKEEEETEAQIEHSKHVRANIEIDVIKELAEEEQKGDPLDPYYRAGSVLAGEKRVTHSIDEAQLKREKAIRQERKKMENLTGTKKSKNKKPSRVELPPNIDIG